MQDITKNQLENKLVPFLWFEKDLDKVVEYYQNIFKDNFKLLVLNEKQEASRGEFQTGSIEIFGNKLDIMAAGPMFKFTEAISFVINTEGQEETDFYWNAIIANGGQESRCGWCKDVYGLSWQIVPKELMSAMSDPDVEKRNYALSQMMQMGKIIIADLVR